MAVSRWLICLALSLACWLALAWAVWAQAPARSIYSPFAPRGVSPRTTVSPRTKASGNARPAPAADDRQQKPAAAPPAEDPLVNWQLLGRSPEGRPIQYVQFGSGEHQVLVIGALKGNEPEGVALAQSLASHLARFPRRLEDVTITIVRDPNPDGRARQTAGNARGIELNQNFLAQRQVGPPARAMMTPAQMASEPETIAIAELLKDIKPERVILLGTSSSRASVIFAGPAEPLAAQVSLEAGARSNPLDTSAAPGALLTFTGVNLAIPSVEIATMPRATADAVWSHLKPALMTAVGCGTPVPWASVPNQPRRAARPMSAPQPAASPAAAAQPAAPASAASVSAAPPADGLQPLMFNQLRFGRPTVQVESPRSLRARQRAISGGSALAPIPSMPPAQPPVSYGQPIAVGADPRVQRLPSVNQYAPPPRKDALQTPLPQRPIPAYPSTGR